MLASTAALTVGGSFFLLAAPSWTPSWTACLVEIECRIRTKCGVEYLNFFPLHQLLPTSSTSSHFINFFPLHQLLPTSSTFSHFINFFPLHKLHQLHHTQSTSSLFINFITLDLASDTFSQIQNYPQEPSLLDFLL
jgi:hypothetical protein